jgi:hypothetical protein
MSVNINDINAKTSDAQARQKGEAFAKAFAAAITSLRNEPKIQSVATMSVPADLATLVRAAIQHRFSLPSPRNAFMFALGKPFGGVQAWVPWQTVTTSPTFTGLADVPVAKPSDLLRLNWRIASSFGGDIWGPDGLVLIPVSKLFTLRGGETHTFSFQAFTQQSDARSREKFVEIYVTQEVGAKVGLGSLPVIGSVFSYDIKTGEKIGTKKTHKWEESKSTRIGRTVSRSFVLEKLGRNCILISQGMSIEIPLISQYAWQVQFKEGGDPEGPFCGSVLALGTDDDSKMAYDGAAAYLETVVAEAALEVAQRAHQLQAA